MDAKPVFLLEPFLSSAHFHKISTHKRLKLEYCSKVDDISLLKGHELEKGRFKKMVSPMYLFGSLYFFTENLIELKAFSG